MKKSQIRLLSVLAILLFTVIPTMNLTAPAAAITAARMYVDPASIIGEIYTPGNNITVYVKVENIPQIPGVCGAQFRLEWDSSVLQGVKIEIPTGHFMDPSGVETAEGNLWIVAKKIYADHAEYGVTYYDIPAAKSRGTAPRYGNGTLAKITLKILTVGRTIIHLKDDVLGDEAANPVDHNVDDGIFDNRPPPPAAHIYVDPDRVVDPTLTPCHNFTINVSITNATDVYRYMFKLNYDPTILHVVDATVGNFFPPTAMGLIETDNSMGYVNFTVWLVPPELPVSGNGTLATITFHVEGLGPSALIISNSTLFDNTNGLLPHSTANGFFNNILMGKLYVDPPEIIDPTMLPPSWFKINITVDDVEDLYHYEFTLAYDTIILTCYGAMLNPDLNGIRPSGTVTYNDPLGLVTVNVSFDPPTSPVTTYEPLPLVTLFFQVDSIGWTNLDLENTNLTDSEGNPIQHEVQDGFFMTLIRDVAITNIVANETQVYPGWFVSIDVTVENQGNISETFNVEVYYDSNLIGTIPIIDLTPSASETRRIEWNTTGVPYCHNYTISAYIPPVPFELDTTDNTYINGGVKIRIPGDVNGDGQVNILDCIIASNSFGATPADPRWNRYCDMNKDYKINILDMIRISNNFGKHC
jgi:hypothetical protein